MNYGKFRFNKHIVGRCIGLAICILLVATSLTVALDATSAENVSNNRLSYSFAFIKPGLQTMQVDTSQYTTLQMPGCLAVGKQAGAPMLPAMATITSITVAGSPVELASIEDPVYPYQNPVPSTRGTIYVDDDAPPEWYDATHVKTIQEGVNNATAGYTVYVYNGTYREHVTVDKQLDLIGESRENVIVDGSGSGNVVYVSVNDVSIDTFTMTNGFYGIYLLSSSNNNIMNCDVYRNKIHGIIIHTYCNNNNIINCNSYGNSQHGIYLELTSGNTITNCNSYNNAKDGIYIYDSSSNNNIINCNSYNNSGKGIRVYLAAYNNIINCTVHNNGAEGIGPSCAPYTNLINCTIYSNGGQGIYCQMSSDHTSITNCSVYSNRYGIQITDTSYLNVLNCDIHDNSDHGLYLFTATNCNIRRCNAYDNEDTGVYIFAFRGDTRNNIITNCNLYNNKYGIRMNDYYGYIYDNLIYHNNFIDNIQNGNDKYTNTWDNGYPSGGNYWDDYAGEDNDGDGIGDTPYHVAGGDNQDGYPFMNPNGWVNRPPNKPNKPSGQTNGKAGTEYTYFTNTTDPDGDQVYYKWDWGDGSYSDWLGSYASGEEASASHTWSQGSYNIKVKAKDIRGYESEWSDPLEVSMPKNQAYGSFSYRNIFPRSSFIYDS